MPPRDPSSVQLDFPQLVSDLIGELRLQGTVGLLDFKDSVQPVYIVSARGGALDVTASQVVYPSASIFTNKTQGPLVNVVLADTGQLPAGTYDIKTIIGITNNANATVNADVEFQHRNAANAANLATVPVPVVDIATHENVFWFTWDYATILAANERLRYQVVVLGFSGRVDTTIMAVARPTP